MWAGIVSDKNAVGYVLNYKQMIRLRGKDVFSMRSYRYITAKDEHLPNAIEMGRNNTHPKHEIAIHTSKIQGTVVVRQENKFTLAHFLHAGHEFTAKRGWLSTITPPLPTTALVNPRVTPLMFVKGKACAPAPQWLQICTGSPQMLKTPFSSCSALILWP